MVISGLIKILNAIDQQGFGIFKVLKNGYSISSYRIAKAIKNHCNEFNTIIDVGANQGQFALAAKAIYPQAKLFSFEPLEEMCEKFRENTKHLNRIELYNVALGTETGVIDFYRNNHTHASSALPISKEQVAAIPDTALTTKIRVKVQRLDEVIPLSSLKGPVLLKLDVQGFEKNVLEGGSDLIQQIDFLVFEASFIPMYEGEPLFDEMNHYLKGIGFQLVAPVGFLEGKEGDIIQMDFLYKNTNLKPI